MQNSRASRGQNERLRYVAWFFLFFGILIIARLFYLQVWQHDHFIALAAKHHDLNRPIFARRGAIFFKDARTGELSIAAVDKDYYTVWADPQFISFDQINLIGERLVTLLGIQESDEQRVLFDKLARRNSQYQVIARKVSEDIRNQIDGFVSQMEKELNKNRKKDEEYRQVGLYTQIASYRFYPEGALAANVLGFGAKQDETKPIEGRYGVEQYWNNILTGKTGSVSGEKSAGGSWITLAGRQIVQAEDGADIVLTIDRNLQYQACEELRKNMKKYDAKSAALVIMDVSGAVLAMCSLPDFDPNKYGMASTTDFNNTAIVNSYEPGSVMKAVTVSIGLDTGVITPTTVAPGENRIFIPRGGVPIENADDKYYPNPTMTDVLVKSINTGIAWLVDRIGVDPFYDYLDKRYNFGKKTGITLAGEVNGSIANLTTKSKEVDKYYIGFGQGMRATPLQMAAAFSVLATEGNLSQPFIVDEVRFSDGKKEKTVPERIENVVSSRTAGLTRGMLVKTMDSYKIRLSNYRVAGKTGTAQVYDPAIRDYKKRKNHTVVGFGPIPDPKIIVVVKYEEPNVEYAETTAGPVFKEVMQNTLKYLGVPEGK